MFKLGFLMESNQLQQQRQPKRPTNWLKPVVGAAAAGGLAYMGDRYLNNGAGANWLKQQFAGGNQPVQPTANPAAEAARKAMPAYEAGLAADQQNHALDGGKLDGMRQIGYGAGIGLQKGVDGVRAGYNYLNSTPAARQAAAAAAKAQQAALPAIQRGMALPGLAAAKAGWLGRVVPGMGALAGGMDEDIAERGMFNVNLGPTANRTLGALGGAATTLNPIGLIGSAVGNAGIGVYNWRTGVRAGQDQTAGNLGDTALGLLRQLKQEPDVANEYAQQFLQLPAVQATMNNPAERHPATAHLLQRLQAALSQQR